MRPQLQLTALLLLLVGTAAGAVEGELPLLGPAAPPSRRQTELITDDGGTRRIERWTFEGKRPRLTSAVEVRGPLTIEGRDSNADGVLDIEVRSRFTDAGMAEQVELSFPLDGGAARRRTVSTALGGNRREVAVQLWRDGGWVTVESFGSTWRDEKHAR